jgi:phage gpG-like protein
MVDIIFRGGRDDARRVIKGLIGQLTGKEPDQGGLARSVFFSLGFAALSDIQADFITKSRGGTGEDGVAWERLSKKYLAYGRRFGPGEQRDLKAAAGLGKQHRHGVGGKGGLLTVDQKKRWNALYRQNIALLAARMEIQYARSMAAAMAWNTIKAEGAKTKLEVYGNRQVDILRDTGVLFNSISPGYFDGTGSTANYQKPSGDGGEQQIFTALTNGIVIGTNVPYARTHQEGDTKRGIPARPFIPKRVPQTWLNRWEGILIQSIQLAAQRAFAMQGAA